MPGCHRPRLRFTRMMIPAAIRSRRPCVATPDPAAHGIVWTDYPGQQKVLLRSPGAAVLLPILPAKGFFDLSARARAYK